MAFCGPALPPPSCQRARRSLREASRLQSHKNLPKKDEARHAGLSLRKSRILIKSIDSLLIKIKGGLFAETKRRHWKYSSPRMISFLTAKRRVKSRRYPCTLGNRILSKPLHFWLLWFSWVYLFMFSLFCSRENLKCFVTAGHRRKEMKDFLLQQICVPFPSHCFTPGSLKQTQKAQVLWVQVLFLRGQLSESYMSTHRLMQWNNFFFHLGIKLFLVAF